MVTLLDEFVHSGPNGLHACLILELLGPSVSTYVEERCPNGRMPGMLAKEVSRQALLGLECLHHLGISHGGKPHKIFLRWSVWLRKSSPTKYNIRFACWEHCFYPARRRISVRENVGWKARNSRHWIRDRNRGKASWSRGSQIPCLANLILHFSASS